MRFSQLVALIAPVALVTACQASVNASAKGSTSGGASAEASGDMKETSTPTENATTAPAPSSTGETTTSSAPVSGSSCPFSCVIADGADMIPVSGDDQGRLSSAFGGTMNAMRQCTGNGSWGRRLSSPVLNVRVNFKGEVTDVGVDTRGFDEIDTCIQSVNRPLPGGNFAGPATIRCAEKCERPQGKARAAGKKPKK